MKSQTVHDRAFVGGRWLPVTGQEVFPIVNPATEEIIEFAHGAGEAEIAAACESAARALGTWSRTPITERAKCVSRIAAEIEARSEPLARLITEEIGTPIVESRALQVAAAVRVFRRTADIGAQMHTEELVGSSKVLRVPVGVVACITPWNYPLFQIACKVAPALVAGCTVVLKPSEVAPGAANALAEIVRQLGLPDGVFNMVIGSGSEVGERIVRSAAVDAVSFTGSVAAGARVAAVCGAAVKRVSLELGGKSASVLLPDADVPVAIERTVAKCFQNAGQTCAALSMIIVPDRLLEEAVDMIADRVHRYIVGDPERESTQIGPVATARQRARVRELMSGAAAEGARLVAGGPGPPAGITNGYYIRPSVYVAAPTMRIAQEEVFGPVLAVLPYAHEEEALRFAHGGDYGLSGAVWSADRAAAERFARTCRTGSISINGAPTDPDSPFGGFRRSGFGRERGRYGIEEFLTTQAIHLGA